MYTDWFALNKYSEYVSYNTLCRVTLQVNMYLLQDGVIENFVKGLR